jgi:nitrous oxidase accessory protein NosD
VIAALLTILLPGTYTLAADIGEVRIAARGVTLDLGGHTIRCRGEGDTHGIYARGAHGLTVRNGSITGCAIGIVATEVDGITIEGLDLSGNGIGLNATDATDVLIRGNDFGGSTECDGYAVGISGTGSGLIDGNRFAEIYPPEGGEAVAILVTAGTPDVTIRGNALTNSREDFQTIGIWIGAGAHGLTIGDNQISGFARAILADVTEDVTVTGNTIVGWSEPGTMGVHLWNCTGCVAEGNDIRGFETLINQQ